MYSFYSVNKIRLGIDILILGNNGGNNLLRLQNLNIKQHRGNAKNRTAEYHVKHVSKPPVLHKLVHIQVPPDQGHDKVLAEHHQKESVVNKNWLFEFYLELDQAEEIDEADKNEEYCLCSTNFVGSHVVEEECNNKDVVRGKKPQNFGRVEIGESGYRKHSG